MIKNTITKFETNFEVVVNYSKWQDLFETQLDLILTFSNDDMGEDLIIGSARLDLDNLIFSFFNGRQTETVMEKRLIPVN